MRWTIALASLLVAGLAHAGDVPPAGPGPGGHGPDANKDGLITREEAKSFPRLAAGFDAWDTNKDGQLDQAEMAAHREAMHREMREHARERWSAADTDRDGALDLAEAQVAMPRLAERFSTVDANGDGKVTPEEMKAARKRGPSE